MKGSRRKKLQLPKRATNQIVGDLVSEIYDQLAAEMVIALYWKKQEIISKLKNER
jgi:hypothetical protein